ncbi:Uncharacterised protein [uncultured archaeon]|nr:Uncharacterised protein [uncultured archaeon]
MKSGEDYMFVMEYENYTNECMSNVVGNIIITDHKNEIVFYNSILFMSIRDSEILDLISYANEIVVESGDFYGTGSIGLPSHCKALIRTEWKAI